MIDKTTEREIRVLVEHSVNNHLNILGFSITEFTSNNKVMEKDLEYIKKDVSDLKKVMTKFIDSVDTKFATREQYEQQKEDLKKVQKLADDNKYGYVKITAITSVVVIVITSLLPLIYSYLT